MDDKKKLGRLEVIIIEMMLLAAEARLFIDVLVAPKAVNKTKRKAKLIVIKGGKPVCDSGD